MFYTSRARVSICSLANVWGLICTNLSATSHVQSAGCMSLLIFFSCPPLSRVHLLTKSGIGWNGKWEKQTLSSMCGWNKSSQAAYFNIHVHYCNVCMFGKFSGTWCDVTLGSNPVAFLPPNLQWKHAHYQSYTDYFIYMLLIISDMMLHNSSRSLRKGRQCSVECLRHL